MKRTVGFLIMLAFSANLKAQTPELRQSEILRGEFTQERRLDGFPNPLLSSGQFVLAPGEGLIWTVEQPFKITTIITPNGLRQKTEDGEVAKIDAAQIPAMTKFYDLMAGALSGDWNLVGQDFLVERSVTDKGDRICLTPKKDILRNAGLLKKITLYSRGFITEVDIDKPNGDSDRLTFYKQRILSSPLQPEELRDLGEKAE